MSPWHKRSEIPALTGFRGIASFLVFVHHYAAPPAWTVDPRFPRFLLIELHSSVGIFFALSGFLMTYLYFDRLNRGELTLAQFWSRRLAKIYPLYAVLLTMMAAYALAMGEPPERWFANLGLHALMVHGCFDAIKFDWLPTSWANSVEWTFYLTLPFTFRALARANRTAFSAGRTIAVLLALSVVARLTGYALQSLHLPVLGFFVQESHWISFTLAGRFLDFAGGILVALLLLEWPPMAVFARPGPANLIGVLGLCMHTAVAYTVNSVGGGRSPVGMRLHFLYAFSATTFLVSLCGPSVFSRFCASKPLQYLGRISYSLYLIHFLDPYRAFLEGVIARTGVWAGIPLTFGLTVLLSGVVYRLVETPAKDWWRGSSSPGRG